MAVLERLSESDTKKYAGKWVAVKDGQLLHAADAPQEIADWLTKRKISADLVYRVPSANDPLNFF